MILVMSGTFSGTESHIENRTIPESKSQAWKRRNFHTPISARVSQMAVSKTAENGYSESLVRIATPTVSKRTQHMIQNRPVVNSKSPMQWHQGTLGDCLLLLKVLPASEISTISARFL